MAKSNTYDVIKLGGDFFHYIKVDNVLNISDYNNTAMKYTPVPPLFIQCAEIQILF